MGWKLDSDREVVYTTPTTDILEIVGGTKCWNVGEDVDVFLNNDVGYIFLDNQKIIDVVIKNIYPWREIIYSFTPKNVVRIDIYRSSALPNGWGLFFKGDATMTIPIVGFYREVENPTVKDIDLPSPWLWGRKMEGAGQFLNGDGWYCPNDGEVVITAVIE